VNNFYLLGGSIAVLILVVVVAIVVPKARSRQRRKALEQILERYSMPGLALVRYVMLNHQCSEEAAYERLATFVKKHGSLDDSSNIEGMAAHNRQNLLARAQRLLADTPNEIDKI
jgi:hypothetical protein